MVSLVTPPSPRARPRDPGGGATQAVAPSQITAPRTTEASILVEGEVRRLGVLHATQFGERLAILSHKHSRWNHDRTDEHCTKYTDQP